jgi:enoyl-CoA hydratase
MKWKIEIQGGAAVVTMRSNPVNKMNQALFDDLHEALDTLEREHPGTPMVLTAEGSAFCVGLDFEDVVPRFARNDPAEIAVWFESLRWALVRVFSLSRRTVAAVNGHAFAGGLILALCCDERVVAEGNARLAVNEVAVGIPMPGSFAEIVRHAIGSPATSEALLGGRVYDVAGARAMGFVRDIVPAADLVREAVARAAVFSPDSADAYAATKKILQAGVQRTLAAEAPELDRLSMQVARSEGSARALVASLSRVKKKG